jgi:hypothetical protein
MSPGKAQGEIDTDDDGELDPYALLAVTSNQYVVPGDNVHPTPDVGTVYVVSGFAEVTEVLIEPELVPM